jgi:hypothetical protein
VEQMKADIEGGSLEWIEILHPILREFVVHLYTGEQKGGKFIHGSIIMSMQAIEHQLSLLVLSHMQSITGRR